jgi:pyridoxal phosphate enzyme (YggS family)
MGTVKENLFKVQESIERAANRVGRNPKEIVLVVVTKTIEVELIRQAISAGASVLGENYVQEARKKIEVIGHTGIQWHLIGHLQTNKAKYAVRLFDMVHSVDSIKLAMELEKRAAAENKVIDCLIEVTLSNESSKFGISKEKTLGLAYAIKDLRNISLKGLMTMPPYFDDPELARPFFISLRKLKEEIEDVGIPLTELSMGMSVDFEVAIEEGATMVRVGRAIFGERR